jgi:acyl carrier protein
MIKVVSRITGVTEKSIDDESSPDTLDGWNSVSHIHLVLALEEEFGIALSPEDATEMLSVRLIELILRERGVAFDAASSGA